MGCCKLMTGIPSDCDGSVGGIRKAWIACWDSVQTPTVADNKISALGGTGNTEWKEFNFRKNTGSFTSTWTIDGAVKYVETEIIFQFSKQETAKRVEINALALSDVAVIIQDSNGLYWYFGFNDYVTLSTATGETGTAKADFNGYNVTLLDESDELPYELSASAIAQLLGTE